MSALRLSQALLTKPFPTPSRYLEGTLDGHGYTMDYLPEWRGVLLVFEAPDSTPVLIPEAQFLYLVPEQFPGLCSCPASRHASMDKRLRCTNGKAAAKPTIKGAFAKQ